MNICLEEAIDTIFSHNEIIAIWKREDADHSVKIWSGMAHELPKEYYDELGWRIFGVVAEKISESDYINIRLAD